ncbi:hypothetical protein LRH25_08665 [Ideonella azotifigens]|nr:choice-of-anchor tandem repeat GloVer-containing protein [Ideonella azotifigens]MCD2340414.1 hypothetical protein [Ideonella azotifigens]
MFDREVVLSSARPGGHRKTFGALVASVAFMAGALVLPAVHAGENGPKFEVLYTFTGGNDGAWPAGNLVADKKGNLYGTTSAGGPNGAGTIYKLAPDGTQTVIHAFNGVDGNLAMSGLLKGSDGNFYGVTEVGGRNGAGNVYKVTPKGELTSIYEFGASNVDGYTPASDLIWGQGGELLGTTVNGGANGLGTVFKVTLDGKLTILHSFTGADGKYPAASLVMDAAGNLYGTTSNTATGSSGTIFKIDASGAFTTLKTFDHASGFFSHVPLTLDADGNLYGATGAGGATGNGTIFKLTPGGTFSVLYDFTGGADGSEPEAGLMLDGKGNLLGTTNWGGYQYNGTVFKLSPDGKLKTLHSFDGTTGSYSRAALLRDKATDVHWFYGTTYAGGSGSGVVYRVTK